MLRFYKLESQSPLDKIRALLALCREHDTDGVRRLIQLLGNMSHEGHQFGRDEAARQAICDEIGCLARGSALPSSTRSGDLTAFINGILSPRYGLKEGVNLPLIVDRLKVSRLQTPNRIPSPSRPSRQILNTPDLTAVVKPASLHPNTPRAVINTNTQVGDAATQLSRCTSPYLPSYLPSHVQLTHYRSAMVTSGAPGPLPASAATSELNRNSQEGRPLKTGKGTRIPSATEEWSVLD
jgi:hypothetical protein